MTKKENLVSIKSILNENGIVDYDAFIDHEIELLSRKRSTSGKPTKNQVANEGIKDRICEILASAEKLRASDVVKLMDEDYSLPKVSALLKQLVESGKVTKVTEKKISWFSLV